MKSVMAQFPNTRVTVQVPQAVLDQALPAERKTLQSPPTAIETSEPTVTRPESGPELVLPRRIGIVKAWDFSGSRVHVEFAVLNDTEHLLAIRDVGLIRHLVATTTDDAAGARFNASHAFKQFVDVTPDARFPSVVVRPPVVVSAKSGIWLCAELENRNPVGFGSTAFDCSLVVSLNTGTVRYHFTTHGDAAFGRLLDKAEKAATQQQGAVVLPLPITPSG